MFLFTRPIIRSILALLILTLSSCAPRLIQEETILPVTLLQNEIDKILARDDFRHVFPSIVIMDAATGKILYSRFGENLVRPASNQKLITSASALYHLGPEYNFQTVLYRSGDIVNGILEGDLILKGYGDPLLTTTELKILADTLITFGIKRINGNIIVDESFYDDGYWPPGWMWDDEPMGFAPFISALSVNGNTVDLIIEYDYYSPFGYRFRTDPPVSDLTFYLQYFPERLEDTPGYRIIPEKFPGHYRFQIRGGANPAIFPLKRRISVGDPALFTGNLFYEILRSKEIINSNSSDENVEQVIKGVKSTHAIPVATILTPLSVVLDSLNKESSNLAAEMLWKTVGAEVFGSPATWQKGKLSAVKVFKKLGIDPEIFELVDGSGVSYYNLVTINSVAELLFNLYHADRDIYEIFNKSLAIMGVDGTLEKRAVISPLQGRFRGKTGTLRSVSSLAGYLETHSGETLIVAMTFQNISGSVVRYRNIQDEICKVLLEF